MTAKQFITTVTLSAVTALGSVWGYGEYQQHQQLTSYSPETSPVFKQASYNETVTTPAVDFEKAATKAAPAVVHIVVNSKPKQVAQDPNSQNPFEDFFGDMFGQRGQSMPSPQRRGSGSGVSISADGYIVTNNHVVDGADDITVTLDNKRNFKAKLVGKDASTDLAVIKIEAKGLPYLAFANSDEVRLGQWVLAVGYP
ncbi:MAG TPA: trypsin-like peptidase domain-containing protein, partial [Segetibacter sp.]